MNSKKQLLYKTNSCHKRSPHKGYLLTFVHLIMFVCLVIQLSFGPTYAVSPDDRFVLSGVRIQGSTVYQPFDFAELYKDHLGKKITTDILRNIAEMITQQYHDDGYALSTAIVPNQKIAFGIVSIHVIEGYIGETEIYGDAKGNTKRLQSYLHKITTTKPLHTKTLEKNLLLITELPSIKIKSEVHPVASDAGIYKLVLDVEQDSTEGFVSIENRGSKEVGPIRVVNGINLNALGGQPHTVQLRYATTSQVEELQFVSLTDQWAINDRGTRLRLSSSYTDSESGGEAKDLNVEFHRTTYALELLHPLLRSRKHLFTLNSEFEIYNAQTDEENERFVEDKLRSIRVGASYVHRASKTATSSVKTMFSKGLNIFGSSTFTAIDASNARRRKDYTKLNLNLSHLHKLTDNWHVLINLSGQHAASPLPSSERFRIGGERDGRAYDPSEFSGDHGAATVLQLGYSLDTWHPVLQGVRLYSYYDFGIIWRIDEQQQDSRESAASAGGGIRYQRGAITGSLEAAKPLTRPVESRGDNGNDARVFANLVYNF